MSLLIDPTRVAAVLLADGWHRVSIDPATGRGFEIDAYEYGDPLGDEVIHGGGAGGICSVGFRFTEEETGGLVVLSGPLTSVLAVRSWWR
jgi:hypothetical protein